MEKKEDYSYTLEDYRHDMPPRAFGSETEYTNDSDIERYIYQNNPGGVHDKILPYVSPIWLVSPGRHTAPSAITKNGGELYLDYTVLEYSTPECTTPQELTLHERAGEQIIFDTMVRIGLSHGAAPKVYKRSGYVEVKQKNEPYPLLDEMSIGHHESYTSLNTFTNMSDTTREFEMQHSPEARQLADFLALRKLIDGVGMVAEDHFSITQKPRSINYKAFERDVGRTGKRPFRQNTSRLEVRSGEGNKSDWAATFKVGLTSMVLRLIEHGNYPSDYRLYDPNTTVLKIARDPLAHVQLESGVTMKAVDILKGIVDAAYELGQQYDSFPQYEQQAYSDFLEFYDDVHKISLQDHDVSALSDRIDWAARFKFFVDYGATYDTFGTDNLEQVRYDLLWDRIGDKDIARKRFAKFGHTALTIEVPSAPQTRAKTRVQIAQELYDNNNLYDVDWDRVSTIDGYEYVSNHPLNKTMERKRTADYNLNFPNRWHRQ